MYESINEKPSTWWIKPMLGGLTQVRMPSPPTPNQIFIVVRGQDKEGKVQSVKKNQCRRYTRV